MGGPGPKLGCPRALEKGRKGIFRPQKEVLWGCKAKRGGGIFEMLQESKPAARGELRGHPAAPMISPMPRLVLLPRGGEAAEG